MRKGLKGSELDKLPKTEEELWDHIEKEHNICVQHPDESRSQAMERFINKGGTIPMIEREDVERFSRKTEGPTRRE